MGPLCSIRFPAESIRSVPQCTQDQPFKPPNWDAVRIGRRTARAVRLSCSDAALRASLRSLMRKLPLPTGLRPRRYARPRCARLRRLLKTLVSGRGRLLPASPVLRVGLGDGADAQADDQNAADQNRNASKERLDGCAGENLTGGGAER